MMEHSDIIKWKKIVQLLNCMKKLFVFHFDGDVSADDDTSPLAKFFEHLAANAE